MKKKSLTQRRETERPRRLTLSRETIQHLEREELLEIVAGGQTTTVTYPGCVVPQQ